MPVDRWFIAVCVIYIYTCIHYTYIYIYLGRSSQVACQLACPQQVSRFFLGGGWAGSMNSTGYVDSNASPGQSSFPKRRNIDSATKIGHFESLKASWGAAKSWYI